MTDWKLNSPSFPNENVSSFKLAGVGALVISPTRELALQIAQVLKPLAEAHDFSSLTLIGGKKLKEEEKKDGKFIQCAAVKDLFG